MEICNHFFAFLKINRSIVFINANSLHMKKLLTICLLGYFNWGGGNFRPGKHLKRIR